MRTQLNKHASYCYDTKGAGTKACPDESSGARRAKRAPADRLPHHCLACKRIRKRWGHRSTAANARKQRHVMMLPLPCVTCAAALHAAPRSPCRTLMHMLIVNISCQAPALRRQPRRPLSHSSGSALCLTSGLRQNTATHVIETRTHTQHYAKALRAAAGTRTTSHSNTTTHRSETPRSDVAHAQQKTRCHNTTRGSKRHMPAP